MDPESGASAYATEVRQAYIMVRRLFTNDSGYGSRPIPKWDGGEDAYGRRHKPVWPRIAAKLLGLSADPYEYCIAQYRAPRARPTTPNMLLSEQAEQAWRLATAEAEPLAAQELSQESVRYSASLLPLMRNLGWVYPRAARYVLGSNQHSLSPLFRYCQAAAEGLSDVLVGVERAALLQYLRRPAAYDVAWSGFLPKPLVDTGSVVRRQMAGR